MRLKNYPYPQSCKLLINKNMSFLSLCPQKNQYDKMEEKKLYGAEKTIYLNRRTRACGAKKECTGMEE